MRGGEARKQPRPDRIVVISVRRLCGPASEVVLDSGRLQDRFYDRSRSASGSRGSAAVRAAARCTSAGTCSAISRSGCTHRSARRGRMRGTSTRLTGGTGPGAVGGVAGARPPRRRRVHPGGPRRDADRAAPRLTGVLQRTLRPTNTIENLNGSEESPLPKFNSRRECAGETGAGMLVQVPPDQSRNGQLGPSLAGVAVTRRSKRRQESCGVRRVSPERVNVVEAEAVPVVGTVPSRAAGVNRGPGLPAAGRASPTARGRRPPRRRPRSRQG